MSEEQNKETKQVPYMKYMIINLVIIALLLLITEVIIDASILHQWILLILTVVICFIPLMFSSSSRCETMSYLSIFLTIVMAIVLWMFRTRVYKFELDEKAGSMDESGKKVLASYVNSNSVVLIFGDEATLQSIVLPTVKFAQKADFEKMGIKGDKIEVKDVLKIRRWSGATHNVVYKFGLPGDEESKKQLKPLTSILETAEAAEQAKEKGAEATEKGTEAAAKEAEATTGTGSGQ